MNFVVAIDGTSGSGKTTTAKLVAEHFGWFYLDTGATYRALTYQVLKEGKDPEGEREVGEVLKDFHLKVENREDGQRTYVNGEDVTDHLRTNEIDRAVTPISKMKVVRERLVDLQRRISENKNVIAEGRDIGTVVFPDAALKIYMDAGLNERVQRRRKQKGDGNSIDEVMKDLKRRDYHDSNRDLSPLKRASDAIFLDTTSLTIQKQVDWVINQIEKLNESESAV
ncbi:(d)CMP kinase [candidate division WOR-3 bacterium]|nr:(d)CMP kinase [candidate division WOR-3 bacterium]MCK4529167.1 (d)CMP kinase [candidate division WOR-3 bacterium]